MSLPLQTNSPFEGFEFHDRETIDNYEYISYIDSKGILLIRKIETKGTNQRFFIKRLTKEHTYEHFWTNKENHTYLRLDNYL